MQRSVTSLIVGLGLLVACDKSQPAPETPEPAAAEAAQTDTEAQPEPEPTDTAADTEDAEATAEEPPAEPPRDSFVVATFNLGWGHDTIGDDPKRALEQRAQTDEDWSWKIAGIAKVVVAAKPDILALHELGGHLEMTEIIDAIEAAGGPKYDYAFVDSEDAVNGHHSAILSLFPVSEERRFDVHMRRHMLADVELPTGDTISVVAIHTPESDRKKPKQARLSQTESLMREVNNLRKQQPVIVLGTLGSNVVPADDNYDSSAPGILSGANTGTDDDNCQDSADVGLVLETTTDEKLADRIFSCDLTMRDAETRGSETIVREDVDPWSDPWPKVAVDKAPHRDISDHLLLLAEIELPKKAEAAGGEGAE